MGSIKGWVPLYDRDPRIFGDEQACFAYIYADIPYCGLAVHPTIYHRPGCNAPHGLCSYVAEDRWTVLAVGPGAAIYTGFRWRTQALRFAGILADTGIDWTAEWGAINTEFRSIAEMRGFNSPFDCVKAMAVQAQKGERQ